MSLKIAIDIGNSRAKVALFDGNDLLEVKTFGKTEFLTECPKDPVNFLFTREVKYIGVASVGVASGEAMWLGLADIVGQNGILRIDWKTPMPVENLYETPQTLGMDRIIAVAGALNSAGKGPLLVIDAGTAINYEFADIKGRYIGGGIAPGIALKFKALNAHTANLPLVRPGTGFDLIGKSTEGCILSGVLWGTVAEVDRTVTEYKSQHGNELKVFLTGGDAAFLRNHLENINFVDENLVLKGINSIIDHNFLNEK